MESHNFHELVQQSILFDKSIISVSQQIVCAISTKLSSVKETTLAPLLGIVTISPSLAKSISASLMGVLIKENNFISYAKIFYNMHNCFDTVFKMVYNPIT